MIIKQISILFLLTLFNLSYSKVNNQSKSSLIEQKQQEIESNNNKALIPSPSPTKSIQSKVVENDDVYRHTIIRETIYVPASNPTLVSSPSSNSNLKNKGSISSNSVTMKEATEPAHILNTLKSIYYILSHPIKLSSSIIPFLSYQFYNLLYYTIYCLYFILYYTIFYPSYYILNIISKPFITIYNILTSPLIITAISAILIGSLLGSLVGLLTGEATKSLFLDSFNLSLVSINKIRKITDWFLGSNKNDKTKGLNFGGRGRTLGEGRGSRYEKIDIKGKGRATMEDSKPIWYEEGEVNRRTITDSNSNSRSDSWEEISDDGDETEDTIRGAEYRMGESGRGGGIKLRREGMFQ